MTGKDEEAVEVGEMGHDDDDDDVDDDDDDEKEEDIDDDGCDNLMLTK
jgi:hypothetical protein